jgi:structural maintenance of chromosome 2
MLTNHKNEQKKLERELHDLKKELKSLEDEYEFIREEKDELLKDHLPAKYKHFE